MVAIFYVAGELIINYILDFPRKFAGINGFLLKYVAIHSIYYIVFLIMSLKVFYRISHQTKNDHFSDDCFDIDLFDIAINSINQLITALISFIFYAILSVIIGSLISFIMLFILLSGPGDYFGSGMLALSISFIVIVITLFISLLYLLAITYMIVIKEHAIRTSISAGYNLINNNWYKSAGYLLFLMALKFMITGVLIYGLPFGASEVSNLIILPLPACLIVSLSTHLESFQHDVKSLRLIG